MAEEQVTTAEFAKFECSRRGHQVLCAFSELVRAHAEFVFEKKLNAAVVAMKDAYGVNGGGDLKDKAYDAAIDAAERAADKTKEQVEATLKRERAEFDRKLEIRDEQIIVLSRKLDDGLLKHNAYKHPKSFWHRLGILLFGDGVDN